MSCDTLNSSAIQLNVSVASLPEGFCPASMQELANAIGSRLIISPSTDFNTFAIGSTAPASNVGPWLKDCEEWFVFDDSTASYVPASSVASGGFKTQEYHTTSGTFTVPDFIYKIEVSIWGGGGGGGVDAAGISTGGGGGGAYATGILSVTPGQMINYTVGAGGASGNPGSAGGTTTFSTLSATGGAGSANGSPLGGAGGTATGGDINIDGQSGHNGTSGFGGAGGDSPVGGPGGTAHTSGTASFVNGKIPGGGGAGDYTSGGDEGDGASGAVLIKY